MKKNRNISQLLGQAIKIYIVNLGNFIKYMSFPVLGQILGLVLIILLSYLYSVNLPHFLDKHSELNNYYALIGMTILVTLPGLALFCKAFWEYLVAYGALNSMTATIVKNGKLYDFNAHNELITRKTFSFIFLWLLYSLFLGLSIFPLFWVIGIVLAIYFVLIFQIFTFEDLSPIKVFQKSFNLIKGHFYQTLFLFLSITIITYVLVPYVFDIILDFTKIKFYLTQWILPCLNNMPEISIPNFGQISHENIINIIISFIFSQIIVQYTLPLRSILWTLWYETLNKEKGAVNKKVSNKNKKRPREKLMENSHKKYGKKILDDDILRRATEKEDE